MEYFHIKKFSTKVLNRNWRKKKQIYKSDVEDNSYLLQDKIDKSLF